MLFGDRQLSRAGANDFLACWLGSALTGHDGVLTALWRLLHALRKAQVSRG